MKTGPKGPVEDAEPRRRDMYHFPGVTVIVPEQVGDQIMPIDKGLVNTKVFRNSSNFIFIRQIANIAFVKKLGYEPGSSQPYITDFNPPIELRVGYNIDDLVKVGCGVDLLKLAYWDGKDWVILSLGGYPYMILPPSTAQVAEVTIDHWVGDPPLAWGG